MKLLACTALAVSLATLASHADAESASPERLGTVVFSNSCSARQQTPINRGVALLHDFWYEEAKRQFQEISKAEPGCAMAHWGVAMSVFHQIWGRPGAAAMTSGREELKKARAKGAKTAREKEYISALLTFFGPGKESFEARVNAYSAAMAKLFNHYPADVDAGSFYALSLMADKKIDDTSVDHERQALAVLTPLFVKYPDHPGVVHYIIHACDNPFLASQGLAAAQSYGTIAPSAAHSAHMPGHIFARLGMWQPDIDANRASIAAGEAVIKDHPSALFDELHAYDFLLYAELQSGRDNEAKSVLASTDVLLTNSAHMAHKPGMDMGDMVASYHAEFPTIFDLEMRNWKAAAALVPAPTAAPEAETFTYWARGVANGHLRQAKNAATDLQTYEALLEKVKQGKHAYILESPYTQVQHFELMAWVAFAKGDQSKALDRMRAAAELQDKVGQGEVDIPAREMLADMLLEMKQPEKALIEYDLALKASPNRLNGLFNAGRAAEAAGQKAKAAQYYAALMQSTGNGAESTREEFAHVKTFLASDQVAQK